jgi:hypothetical protein
VYDILGVFGISGGGSYLNKFMDAMQQNDLAIIGSVIFVANAYYLLLCAIKGNLTYGARTACFTFYPIT